MTENSKVELKREIEQPVACAVDYLAQESGLPKKRLKDAMVRGAVWLIRGGQERRLRRATSPLRKGDRVELYYDPALLALKPPRLNCIEDRMGYSLWYKTAGVMSQGTRFGDHMSLPRIAETAFENKREVFPVHRLDRETRGLMLLAHNRKMAAQLSRLFQEGAIEKGYQAVVLGEAPLSGCIDRPLDGKSATTRFERLEYDPVRNTSLLEIRIEHGRTHQIRRHLDSIGHPVMGDPRYGQGNKNREGLLLVAHSLRFICPMRRQAVDWTLPQPFVGSDSSKSS
ncbi:pseudouridine synthase [Marinobacterium nitratireducens]|uniref:Pseudouridine synthase n=1 Tax=Marinobacterium nitratireducens TaxID=518897 RepID=A0A917ZQF1_9GAMM|nr:RluA family pseudouridine synthase [Marinobacterium nitratireducens]GGO87328.1 pseudouridine synthase [Marinobacterium nitratireducens]